MHSTQDRDNKTKRKKNSIKYKTTITKNANAHMRKEKIILFSKIYSTHKHNETTKYANNHICTGILHVKGVGVWVGVGVVIRAIVDLKICWSERGGRMLDGGGIINKQNAYQTYIQF